MRWWGIGLVVLLLAGVANAEPVLVGQVVGIVDGDTIDVLDAERVTHRVRLAGIDTPEKKQAWGSRATGAISALVFGKQVVVEWEKRDRYGRVVGKVLVAGLDANLEQVKAGLAWHYKKYANEQAIGDQLAYADAEMLARTQRVGLWADADPVPPWEWRHKK